MTPLDFFLWGYLKSMVYKNKPSDLEQLKRNIVDAIREIPTCVLENVMASCLKRMLICKQESGGHIEHLI